jgi:glycosyltransferase involved in cell wall biosynthesis
VDDGSDDDPHSVVAAIGDSRIRFLRQAHRGGGAARNAGIDLAAGRYIAFLESDDRFLPHHLSVMKVLLDRNAGAAAYARMSVDRGNGNAVLRPPRAIAPGEHMADYLLCERGFVPAITLAVEAQTARRVRYDDRLGHGQDTDFAIRLYLAGCRFVMAEEPGAICEDVAGAARKEARLAVWLGRCGRISPPAPITDAGAGSSPKTLRPPRP